MGSLSAVVRLALAGTLFVLFASQMADACSCMQSHPQDYVCRADFVIVARVKKHFPKEEEDVYKVAVKQEFKMSEKARVALKSGRLFTSSQSSSCGVNLRVDETYLIVGNVWSGKPRMHLCSFIKPWKEVTVRQRKGFRLLYKLGCDSSCEIMTCPWYRQCPPAENDVCAWTTQSFNPELEDCQLTSSVCTRHPGGSCNWTQNRVFRECMKGRKRFREEEWDRKEKAKVPIYRRSLPHK